MPAVVALGIVTSYEDIKHGKIRNKWVVLALVYAFITHSILIIYFYSTTGINQHYLFELLTNFLFVIAVGFGAWYLSIWTAGDGKLFIAFSALIPFSVYKVGYQEWVPSFTLLINIFIPALLIMTVFMLLKLRIEYIKKVLKSFLKEFFQPKQLLNSIIFLFAIFWLIQLFLSSIGLYNYILRLVLTMIIFSIVQKKLGNKALYVMLIVSLLRFVVDKSVYSFSFLVDFLILVFIWKLFRSFLSGSISKLGQEVFTKNVKVDKLKPGMILSEIIQKKEKLTKKGLDALKKIPDTEIIKCKQFYYIKKPKAVMDLDNFIGEEAEGLTREQINKIKRLGIKKIRVSQTIPFAPFIFLGVILTIIANGNILIVVKNLV